MTDRVTDRMHSTVTRMLSFCTLGADLCVFPVACLAFSNVPSAHGLLFELIPMA